MSHAVLVFFVFAILLLLPCPLNLFLIPRVRRMWNIVRWLRILRREELHTCRSIRCGLRGFAFRNLCTGPFLVHVSTLVLVPFRLCLLRIRILRSFGRPSTPSISLHKPRIHPPISVFRRPRNNTFRLPPAPLTLLQAQP